MKNILHDKYMMIILSIVLLGALMSFFLLGDIYKKNKSEIYISSIKGSDFVYQELSRGNKSILCPSLNTIHLNSAALSQIGRDVAKSIVNSKKLK